MDTSGFNPYPTGSNVDVWWPGNKAWYRARVTDTRINLHKVKGSMVPSHEVYCHYEIDDWEQWHSLHNNKIRSATAAAQEVSIGDGGAQMANESEMRAFKRPPYPALENTQNTQKPHTTHPQIVSSSLLQ